MNLYPKFADALPLSDFLTKFGSANDRERWHGVDKRVAPLEFTIDAPGLLLDAGSILNFDFVLEHPALQNKNLHICTLAPEAECFWHKGISYLFGDLRRLPYRDDWFDWIVSLSTLEHVGMDNTMLYTGDDTKKESRPLDYLQAVAEFRRVLKPGGTLFVSVPFGRAQSNGWLQVFDQSGIERMVRGFGAGSCLMEYFFYNPEGWQRSTASEAGGATFFDIHHAPGYDSDFAASARAICCLELKKSIDAKPS
jgi:SAM-dependent methyltransferase